MDMQDVAAETLPVCQVGKNGQPGQAEAESIEEKKAYATNLFKMVRAAGNGSCLFISLRLGLEMLTLLKMKDEGQKIEHGIIDGHNSAVLESAENLRNDIIIQWFQNGLDKTVPSFGVIDFKSQKLWTRGDIIVMETANLTERDAPEEPEKRLELQKAYLKHMYAEKVYRPGGRVDYKTRNWGGQAEYTAFALISKVTVEVWHMTRKGLVKHNEIVPPGSTGTFKILFSGKNHYDLLLSNEEASKIKTIVPEAKISSF